MVVFKTDKKVGRITLILLALPIETVKSSDLKELTLDVFKYLIFVQGLTAPEFGEIRTKS